MTPVVQTPQIHTFSYIIVLMCTGSDCTIAKEVCRLDDRGYHENRIDPSIWLSFEIHDVKMIIIQPLS